MGKNILKRIDLIFKEEPDSKNVLKNTEQRMMNDKRVDSIGLRARWSRIPTGLKWKFNCRVEIDREIRYGVTPTKENREHSKIVKY